MPTTDKNGVVQLQTNDLITPFQSAINSVSGSISNVLTTLKKDIIYRATNQNNAIAKKNALIEQGIVGTPNAPLLFYFTNLKVVYSWDGSSWNQIAPENNVLVVDGVRYQECGRVSSTVDISKVLGSSSSGWFYGITTIDLPSAAPPGYQYVFTVADTGVAGCFLSRVASATSASPKLSFLRSSKADNMNFIASWRLQSRGNGSIDLAE